MAVLKLQMAILKPWSRVPKVEDGVSKLELGPSKLRNHDVKLRNGCRRRAFGERNCWCGNALRQWTSRVGASRHLDPPVLGEQKVKKGTLRSVGSTTAGREVIAAA